MFYIFVVDIGGAQVDVPVGIITAIDLLEFISNHQKNKNNV